MPVSDAEFDSELDAIVKMTFTIVEEQKSPDYFTTIFLMHEGGITIQGLVHREGTGLWNLLRKTFHLLLTPFRRAPQKQPPEKDEPVDTYDLIYRFGVHQGNTTPCPDAVFVAAEGWGPDGAESIVITGYTQDGRANVAHLSVERSADRAIRLSGSTVHHLSDGGEIKWRRNAAEELMRGFKDGANR